MFQLHERARRAVCVALFLALGVAPTLLVAAWCIERHLPGLAQDAADQWGRELGLKVTLNGLRQVRPGVTRYDGVQLAQPESGRLLAGCRWLEVGWSTDVDAQGSRVPWLVLTTSRLEIDADGLDELSRLVQHVMQSRTSLAEPHVRLVMGNVLLASTEGTQTLGDVQAQIESLPAGVQTQLVFRVSGLAMPQPARICLSRTRQTSPPATRIDFSTGGVPLPCGLLTKVLPELGHAGRQSRFQGYLSAVQMPDGWQGEVAGQLSEIDLDRLLGEWSAHKLSGTGQVTVEWARFRRGRLEEATGLFSAGPGVISRSLLTAAVERLGLTRGSEPAAPGDLVPYEQLIAQFLLDGQGLRLHGRCAGDALLVDRYTCLLRDPAVQPLPAAALVQTLAPSGSFQVSANRQSQGLLQLLPLPSDMANSGQGIRQ